MFSRLPHHTESGNQYELFAWHHIVHHIYQNIYHNGYQHNF